MLQAVINCLNCGQIMNQHHFQWQGENMYLGTYVCPMCRIIELPDKIDLNKIIEKDEE